MAIIEATDEITNRDAVGIFVDTKKAFDTINHDILIRKRGRYGIRGTVMNYVLLTELKAVYRKDSSLSSLVTFVQHVWKLFVVSTRGHCWAPNCLHYTSMTFVGCQNN